MGNAALSYCPICPARTPHLRTQKRATRQPPARNLIPLAASCGPLSRPFGPTSSALLPSSEVQPIRWVTHAIEIRTIKDQKTNRTSRTACKWCYKTNLVLHSVALTLWLLRGGTGSSICRLLTDLCDARIAHVGRSRLRPQTKTGHAMPAAGCPYVSFRCSLASPPPVDR